jgi:hypothetical protein
MKQAQYKPYRIVDESDVAFVGSLVTKKVKIIKMKVTEACSFFYKLDLKFHALLQSMTKTFIKL